MGPRKMYTNTHISRPLKPGLHILLRARRSSTAHDPPSTAGLRGCLLQASFGGWALGLVWQDKMAGRVTARVLWMDGWVSQGDWGDWPGTGRDSRVGSLPLGCGIV